MLRSSASTSSFFQSMSHSDDNAFLFEEHDLTGAQSQTASAPAAAAAAPYPPAAQPFALPRTPSRTRTRSGSSALLAGANNSFEALRRVLSGAPDLRPSNSGAHLYLSSSGGSDFDFVPPDADDEADDQLSRLSSRLSLAGTRGDSRSVLRLSSESLSALLDSSSDHSQSAAVTIAAAAAAAAQQTQTQTQQQQQSAPQGAAAAAAASAPATSAYAYGRGLYASGSTNSLLLNSSDSLSSLWLSKTLMTAPSASSSKAGAAPTKPTWFLGDAASDAAAMDTAAMDLELDSGAAAAVTQSPPLASQLPMGDFSLEDLAAFERELQGAPSVDAAAAPTTVSTPLTSDNLCYFDALGDEDYAKFDSQLPPPPERVEHRQPTTSHLLPVAATASPSAAVAKVRSDRASGLRRVAATGHGRPLSAMSHSSVGTSSSGAAASSVSRRKPVRETKRQRDQRLKQVTERNVELKRNLETARSVIHETLHLVYLVWKDRQLA